MDDADNSRYDDSYSTDNYSVSENGMPKLRRRDDSSSDDTDDDNSLLPDGYEYEYHSEDSYVFYVCPTQMMVEIKCQTCT